MKGKYMSWDDKVLKCCDCEEEFTFTKRDQEFYKQNGYADPKRCKNCRMKKKQQRENQGDKPRKDFNRYDHR